MSLLAVDPGSEQSAIVELDGDHTPLYHGLYDNGIVRDLIIRRRLRDDPPAHLAIEMIASYGMPVGKEVFDTCVWIGRFIEAWSGPFTLVYRRDVKMFLCGNNTARDGNIRQALIDRFGGKDAAIGKKKTPGPLYGFHDDLWSALAVGVTWRETYAKRAA